MKGMRIRGMGWRCLEHYNFYGTCFNEYQVFYSYHTD